MSEQPRAQLSAHLSQPLAAPTRVPVPVPTRAPEPVPTRASVPAPERKPVPAPANALHAVRAALLTQCDLMAKHSAALRAAGVAGCGDPAVIVHLHQLRVALRRSRAVLSLLRAVFPEREGRRFRKRLRWIGQITGPTRDLDVWLDTLAAYERALPPDERAALQPLHAILLDQRRAAHARLLQQLGRKRFAKTLGQWRALLLTSEAELAPRAMRPERATAPVAEVVTAKIGQVWARLVETARVIGPESSDLAVHAVRLETKKLRYLIRLFQDLLDPDTDAALLALRKPLRRLQRALGDFNDAYVQLWALRGLTHAADSTLLNDLAPREVLAIGQLVGHVRAKKSAAHRRVEGRLRRLIGDELAKVARSEHII